MINTGKLEISKSKEAQFFTLSIHTLSFTFIILVELILNLQVMAARFQLGSNNLFSRNTGFYISCYCGDGGHIISSSGSTIAFVRILIFIFIA
jgi:hypothetical protein